MNETDVINLLDLFGLHPDALEAMRGQLRRIDAGIEREGVPPRATHAADGPTFAAVGVAATLLEAVAHISRRAAAAQRRKDAETAAGLGAITADELAAVNG